MSVPILGQGGLQQPKVDGPQIRVLFCLVCNSFEQLPLYDGPWENDHLLQILVDRHVFDSGEPHKGHLFRVDQLAWESKGTRERMIEQITGGGSKGIDEFDAKFYDTRNTFQEDAMACFIKHLRPANGCADYNSPSKRLVPDTKEERKDAGLVDPMRAPGPKNYLCQFCPVQSTVQTKLVLRGAK